MSVRVKDIMVKTVVTADGSKSVIEVAKLMGKKDVGCVVVVDGNKPLGIVTERDLVRRVIAKNLSLETRVGEIVSKPLVTVTPELSAIDAAQEMADHKVRRLVVVEGGKVVGLLTASDLVKNLNEITKLTVAALLRGAGMGSLMG